MSHVSRIKTQMLEGAFLKQALQDLGYSFTEQQVRGAAPAFKVRTGFFSFPITFRKPGNTYECTSESAVRLNQQRVVARVTQRYAYHASKAKLEEQGFTISSEEIGNDGRIHLVLRRAV